MTVKVQLVYFERTEVRIRDPLTLVHSRHNTVSFRQTVCKSIQAKCVKLSPGCKPTCQGKKGNYGFK